MDQIKNASSNSSEIFVVNSGNESFMGLASTALWILIPGCGFFYSGMAQSKSAMSMILMSLWSIAIVNIQWFLIGYSLTFSTTSTSLFVGNFQKAFYIGIGEGEYRPGDEITELSFCFYQGVTAALPSSLICGVLAERGRILPALIFIFLWTTFVYCPCAYWSLNPTGWSYKLGVIDFGGGAPVHLPAGGAAVAYSYLLGPRNPSDRAARPHSMFNIILGTVLIWFGSFGYNAGSGTAFGDSIRGVRSCIVTNLSGSIGALTWSFLDFIAGKKCTGFGFCAGAMVGLIVITPASGFVHPACAVPFGILGSIVCRWGHFVKINWKFDDTLDVFAMHGLAGLVGILLAGVFAQKKFGGDEIQNGGWLDGNWLQVPIQLADCVAGFVLSFVVSILILYVMNKIPLLQLRTPQSLVISVESAEDEFDEEMDMLEMGLPCYEHIEQLKDSHMKSLKWSVVTKRDVRLDSQKHANTERHHNWQSYWF